MTKHEQLWAKATLFTSKPPRLCWRICRACFRIVAAHQLPLAWPQPSNTRRLASTSRDGRMDERNCSTPCVCQSLRIQSIQVLVYQLFHQHSKCRLQSVFELICKPCDQVPPLVEQWDLHQWWGCFALRKAGTPLTCLFRECLSVNDKKQTQAATWNLRRIEHSLPEPMPPVSPTSFIGRLNRKRSVCVGLFFKKTLGFAQFKQFSWQKQ